MKYKTKVGILFVSVLLLMCTSCARKIIGHTPHRRERNCGCEMPVPASADSLLHAPSSYCMN
ncbi:MAG: hypothetical protein J6T13_00995 [Bacteroidales bacterium]|nr:hypothetical protein [Bacteroidales bacterium]MBO7648759.1 hypothetical protein [Bacteroidales bacterium]